MCDYDSASNLNLSHENNSLPVFACDMIKKMSKRSNTDTISESERFVDFARKLVSVPKEEIDQKQAEYHKRRIAERKAQKKGKLVIGPTTTS